MTVFGERLHRVRWGRDLSVREAARQAGVSPGLWSNVENGRRAPGAATRPLLEAWLAEEPHPFPAHRVDGAIALIERYAAVLDEERKARLRACC